MITELLLIATAGIIDPMDMSGHQMYPSGIKEVDKYPKYAPPASKMASLSLPRQIVAADGRVINAGHYLVSLSVSKDEILIFEGTKNVYTLKITEKNTVDKELKYAVAKFYTNHTNEALITLRDGKYFVSAKVQLYID